MIEECYDLFRKYCKQEFIYFASLNFYDDESGEIKDANKNINACLITNHE